MKEPKIRQYIRLSDEMTGELEAILENRSLTNSYEKIGHGRNADVFRFHNMALKLFYEPEVCNMMGDATPLKVLGFSPFFPDLYSRCSSKFVLMELIEGMTLRDFAISQQEWRNEWTMGLKRAFKDMFSRNVAIDDLNLSNIIIRNDKPVIVDTGDYYNSLYFSEDIMLSKVKKYYELVKSNPENYPGQ